MFSKFDKNMLMRVSLTTKVNMHLKHCRADAGQVIIIRGAPDKAIESNTNVDA